MVIRKSDNTTWVKAILFCVAVYSLVWGFAVVCWPAWMFHRAAADLPNYLYLWQTIGYLEIVWGISFLLILGNPIRYWPLILAAFLYKLGSGAIFFKHAAEIPALWRIGDYIFSDHLIWIIPFGAILFKAYQHAIKSDDMIIEMFSSDQYPLEMFETSERMNLQEMSESWPTLVVFLRHFGCTFCREALHDIAQQRKQIEEKGTRILIVHMLEDDQIAREQLSKFGLHDVPSLSDPEKLLYKRFKLRNGTPLQLFGMKVILRGIWAGVFKRLGVGPEMGDPFQMPGVFLLFQGKIKKSFIHNSAADRPPYIDLAKCEGCGIFA